MEAQSQTFSPLANKLGDTLRKAIDDSLHIETDGWAVARTNRIAARLQLQRGERESFLVVVPWMSAHTAFTAPGRHIYISRRLLERCANDDMAAFVIAHEMAHHDLGHLDIPFPQFESLGILVALLQRHCHSQDKELDADQYAIRMCFAAGYDPEKCARIFPLLTDISLDYRDLVGVFGIGDEDLEVARRSHPPLLMRHQVVRSEILRLGKPPIGEHPIVLRQSPYREHCGECANAVMAWCTCGRRLCATHAYTAEEPCLHCGAGFPPQCLHCPKVCRECGRQAVDCHHCEKQAASICEVCQRTYCEEHKARRDERCPSCRLDKAIKKEFGPPLNVSVFLGFVVFLVVGLLFAAVVDACFPGHDEATIKPDPRRYPGYTGLHP